VAQQAPNVQATPIPFLDVEAVLGRLPAEVRAQVIWAKRPIQEALSRLRCGVLNDAVVEEAAMAIIKPSLSLTNALWGTVTNRDGVRAALLEDFNRDEAQLRDYLNDEDAADTLSWLVAFGRSFFGMVFMVFSPDQLATIDPEELEKHAADPRLTPLYKSQVALMAAVECSKHGDPRERAIELLEIAFLEMMSLRDVMRQDGLWLPLFPEETPAQRREATLRYALALRDSLSDDDWAVLKDAQMGNLR
jgi:hypothetical protein